MRRIAIIAAILPAVMASAPSVLAQSATERRQIAQAVERGRLLHGLDRAAWVATDDLLARMPNAEAAGVRGYFVERADDGFVSTFYMREGDRFVAAYRAQVIDGAVANSEIFPDDARPTLTPAQLRLAQAVETAHEKARTMERCGPDPFNVIAIPPEAPNGPIDVYVMTPQTSAGFPFGGHYRITLDATGRETARRAFARSCLRMPLQRGPAGEAPAAMVVSNVVDPIPTEIHAFTSLAAGVPVFVVTTRPRRAFAVTGSGAVPFPMPGR